MLANKPRCEAWFASNNDGVPLAPTGLFTIGAPANLAGDFSVEIALASGNH
ncbi:hypothetical protein [Pseudomonas nicosulfuronedens]